LPPAKIWKIKYPLAHAHLSHAKYNLAAVAAELTLPLENLLTPELVRKICFDDGKERVLEFNERVIAATQTQLRLNGAREWQIEKCATILSAALAESDPLPPVQEVEQSEGAENSPSIE
jgi:ribonuclease D